MPKKLKDIEKFDLARALLSEPVADRRPEAAGVLPGPTLSGDALTRPGPSITPAESTPIDLGLPTSGKVSTPENISLEKARGLDLDSLGSSTPAPASGTFHADDRHSRGRGGGEKGAKKTLGTIVRLITGAGRGMSAADEQRFPTLLGGIGKAADMVHRDAQQTQDREMARESWLADQRDKDRRFEMDREKHEMDLEKAGYETDLAAKEVARYDQVMDDQHNVVADKLAASDFDRHMKQAMLDLKISDQKLREDNSAMSRALQRARAKYIDEQVSAGIPRSVARLNAEKANQMRVDTMVKGRYAQQVMDNATKRADASVRQSEAAIMRASQASGAGRGGVSSLYATMSRNEKEITNIKAEIDENVSYGLIDPDQAEKLFNESAGRLILMNQQIQSLVQGYVSQPSPTAALPGSTSQVGPSPDPLGIRTSAGAF